ncbi:(Fe-S)-binding protein [Desulfovibrio inopinatus]|uniref:(Fe-S)-binding protein n=1 Tax=Desulfovibrio inopinatus TaxID=102109 RepID=UPI0004138689|nr:(Fe-S)-binding protein [Desulfovibrio inopinatus]
MKSQNGSTLQHNVAEKAIRKDCILCGKCLEVCPLFNATDREEFSPKAKFLLQKLLDEENLLREKPAVELAGLCLSCGKCAKACPRGLCVPDLLSEVRSRHPGFEHFIWKTWVEKARYLWPVMSSISRLAPNLPSLATQGMLGRLTNVMSDLKALNKQNRIEPWLRLVGDMSLRSKEPVALFPGCVASHAHTDWLDTARRLLAHIGVTALPISDFTCCANTLGHAGLKDAQHGMQLQNLEAWRRAGRPRLTTFCATCGSGLRGYTGFDLGWQDGERELWLSKMTSLAQELQGIRFEVLDNAPHRVLYHKPCHGTGGNDDLALLRAVLGERLVHKDKKSLCCGFGGMFKLSASSLSNQVAEACWQFHDPGPGEQLLTGCSGCVVQLKSTAPKGSVAGHWLEIIG